MTWVAVEVATMMVEQAVVAKRLIVSTDVDQQEHIQEGYPSLLNRSTHPGGEYHCIAMTDGHTNHGGSTNKPV